MYKIVTCNCKRYHLDQLNITYTYSLFFDNCLCSTEHDILAKNVTFAFTIWLVSQEIISPQSAAAVLT